jgi:polyhydroxybutyrate depolymerase
MKYVAFALIGLLACAGEEIDRTKSKKKDPHADDGGGGIGAGGGGGSMVGPGGSSGSGVPGSCAPGEKIGDPAGAVGDLTPGGIDYIVRTPPAYDATAVHPLVVVYSPYGVMNPAQNEAYIQMTPPTTARGWMIAYVNHVSPADQAAIVDASLVIDQIAAKWCVDPARVYLTGHSDGGSIATLIAINDIGNPHAAAIAPSAAGAAGSTLAGIACPPPLPVMVLHSQNDALFPPPDFGIGAANWWAGCDGCGAQGAQLPDGCVAYDACPTGHEVEYCQGTAAHPYWPAKNEEMLDFFAAHARM